MAYDEELAGRVRALLTGAADLSEGRMFGGLAFLLRGNMAVCASSQGGLMVRVDPAATDELVATTAAEPVEMRGSPMRGWVRVGATAVLADAELAEWVARGVAAATALPPKTPRSRSRRTPAERPSSPSVDR